MVQQVIIEASRNLRKKQTFAEEVLWSHLRWRKLWYKFLRQKPLTIKLMEWIVRDTIIDFYCAELKLIIEVDWDVHKNALIAQKDREKTEYFQSLWFRVLRFSNDQIRKDIWVVIQTISDVCNMR